MSTDRELLELAAKAAGMFVLSDGVEWPRENTGWFFNQVGDNPPALYDRASNTLTEWAPPTDDGDALRLAMKLAADRKLRILVMGDDVTAFQHWDGVWVPITWTFETINPSEAFRRAIVRAAAEIGRNMP